MRIAGFMTLVLRTYRSGVGDSPCAFIATVPWAVDGSRYQLGCYLLS